MRMIRGVSEYFGGIYSDSGDLHEGVEFQLGTHSFQTPARTLQHRLGKLMDISHPPLLIT